MDNFQYSRLIEAIETQTNAIRAIHHMIVRIITWSIIGGLVVSFLAAART